MQVATVVPDVEQVRLARAELERWREHAESAIKERNPLRAAAYGNCYERLPRPLRERISEALMACQSPLEARIVFASVQDHQLCASS